MLWVLLAPFSHMVCKETIAGQRVVGPLYPLMHVNMHCRAVDGLQPHDVHQATNTVSSGCEARRRKVSRNLAASEERVLSYAGIWVMA